MENSATTKVEKKENVKRVPRIHSIDLFRAIGILIMIFGHFGLWFLNGDELSWAWWDDFAMKVGPMGAPFFLICVGFSLVFFVENKRRKGISDKGIRNAILRRSLFIWISGYVLNLAIEDLSRWWIWNIIVLIGFCSIIAYYLLELSIKNRIIISSILLALNPLSQLYGIVFNSSIEIHDLWNPFALNLIIIGTIIGEFTLDNIKTGEISSLPKIFLQYGILLCIFGAVIDINLWQYPGVMPLIYEFEHEIHIIFSVGIFLSFFSFFFWLQDVKKRNVHILRHISLLSTLSFTIFVAHHLIAKYFFGPIFRSNFAAFNIFYFIKNPIGKTIFFQIIMHPANLITTYSLQMVSIVFILFFWVLAVFWTRYKLKYSLEWVIRKLS